MIQLTNISKTYKCVKRNAGFCAAFKALFKKEYEYMPALKDISFTINAGEMVGLLGPDGAGKSTVMKIMCGMLVPDSGACFVDGLTPWKSYKEHIKNIGVLFGQSYQLWPDAPVMHSYAFIQKHYSIEPSTYKKNLDALTELLDLPPILRTPAKNLSLEQRVRCEIAGALLHNPKVLFLDEPLTGMDSASKYIIKDYLKKINLERKTAIILASSDTLDIESLTERVLLLDKGRVLFDGPLSELKKRSSLNKTVTVQYNSGDFEPVAGITLKKKVSGCAVFTVDTDKIPMPEAISLLSKRADITSISIAGESVAEIVSIFKEETGT